MGSNIYIQLFGLLFNILLIGMFLSKKRKKNKENVIYFIILFVSLISNVFHSFATYLIYNDFFNAPLFIKGYFGLKIIFTLLIGKYFYYYLFSVKEQRFNKKCLIRNVLLVTGLSLPLFFLSLDWSKGLDKIIYSGGSVSYTIIIFLLLAIYTLILFLIRKNKITKLQKINVLATITFLIISGFIYYLDSEILFINIAMIFITFILYLTLDDSDIVSKEGLEQAKKQVEETEIKTENTLLKASHEIRTPLNTILGIANSSKEEKYENIQEDIEHIIEASNSLLSVLNNILDLNNPYQRKYKIECKKYDLNNLLKQLELATKANLKTEAVEFKMDLANNLPQELYGDVIRVKQILLEILNNAVKHTKEGYIKLSLRCLNIGTTCRLMFTISDTGKGIKDDILYTVFDNLEYNDEDETKLCNLKNIVNALNGKIFINSKLKKGTTVKLNIDQKLELEEQGEKIELPDISGKKILVVDDDKINLKIVPRLLNKYNLEIDTVESGLECLNKVKSNSYDLILLDDWMPGMSGVETLTKLKENKNFNTPTVALTANVLEGKKEYLRKGFSDFIAKPININELEKVLYKFLK